MHVVGERRGLLALQAAAAGGGGLGWVGAGERCLINHLKPRVDCNPLLDCQNA